MESRFIRFKLDYSKTKNYACGKYVLLNNVFSAGGFTWTIVCYPAGIGPTLSDNGEYLSLCLLTEGKPQNPIKCIFKAFAVGADGAPLLFHANWSKQVTYTPHLLVADWSKFMKRSDLEAGYYLVDGFVRFTCGITVVHDDPAAVPRSDGDGSDVSFLVGGEAFRAHRAVLAAGSPVFRALLFGSMAEATMDRVTLHDVQPAAFRILLRFMYTDALPEDGELEGSSSTSAMELLQHLLAVADMYLVEKLKVMCAQKLCDRVSSPETLVAMLGCAETHNCPELKKRCIDFFVENFKNMVLNEEYLRVMQSFPSVIDEIKARCHKKRKPNRRYYGMDWVN